jgi:SPP1 gp7 family putative phage head morphogenesis protein
MPSVNESLRDRLIRHQIYLERFKAHAAKELRKDIAAPLDDMAVRIRERLEGTRFYSVKPDPQMSEMIALMAADLAQRVENNNIKTLNDLAAVELAWVVGVYREETAFAVDFTTPSLRTIEVAARGVPFSGLTLKQWHETLAQATQRSLTQAAQRAVVNGATIPNLMREIRGTRAFAFKDGILETTRRQAETIARTAIQHITNQARYEFFQENADLLKGLQFVATLDGRTTIQCAALDGKVFPLNKGPRPPLHANCRSKMVGVLKSAKELGIKDLPEDTRVSMDGQVPASKTYGQWLRAQSNTVQDSVLGPARAKLFRDGGLQIEQFVGKDYTPMTLQELKAAEPRAFNSANVRV